MAGIINSPQGINSRLEIVGRRGWKGGELENMKLQTTENIQNETGIPKINFFNKHSDWSPCKDWECGDTVVEDTMDGRTLSD